MNLKNLLICIFPILLFTSCESNISSSAIAQDLNTGDKISQSEFILPQTNSAQIFAKTFIIKRSFSDVSNRMIYKEIPVDFRIESKELSIYINDKKSTFLKFNAASPRIRADFLETDGQQRYFVLILNSAMGTCSDVVFAVAKIDENLNAKISKPNESECQGELYPVKLETIDKEKEFYRQLSIGRLKFNLESFEWVKSKSSKAASRK